MPVSGLSTLFDWVASFLRVPAARPAEVRVHHLDSHNLERRLQVDVYLPSSVRSTSFPLVIFHDGQDLVQMNAAVIQQELIASAACPPFVMVGIHANGRRLQEYGTIQRTDYAGRGKLAPQHARFVVEELLPYLQQHYPVATTAAQTTIAGFSLGGLAAFDLAWHYPQHFSRTGVFSGALWWRSRAFSAADPDGHRIVHTQVATAKRVPELRFWFQTGTLDETDDRNHNGVIDSIDDTLDLIRELEARGYHPEKDLQYLEITGGRHEPATWAVALPHFLRWAIGKQP
jgi:enterochelin esterase-like enzyme